MALSVQRKATLPHEAVELLLSSTNQIAVTSPTHQITLINNEELESTAHTVMFVTTDTSSNAVVAIPTSWGQKQGILMVMAKSQECLRYYSSDSASSGTAIANAPIWYRAKKPIVSVTVQGIVAILQTATEWIALISDAVTCREIAVHPLTSSVGATKVTTIRSSLSNMSRGTATFISATTSPTSNVIDVSVFTVSSSSLTLVNVLTINKTSLASSFLTINAESGVVVVPTFTSEDKSSVEIQFTNARTGEVTKGSFAEQVKKFLSILPLTSNRWLAITPTNKSDQFNAEGHIFGDNGKVIYSNSILIGNEGSKLEKRLVASQLPSGRAVIISGHDIFTVKVTSGSKSSANVQSSAAAQTSISLSALLKAKTKADATASSSIESWETLVDASATDVFGLLERKFTGDVEMAERVFGGFMMLQSLPDVASTALSQLPFSQWYKAAVKVGKVHSVLKICHLVFLTALKRGAVTVCNISARAFDALYATTGNDNTSASIAQDMRTMMQQLSTWSNEQMGKQVGLVTVHCTGKSPAIKQAMFVPHQPFSVSVKRHADIDRLEYSMALPPPRTNPKN